MSFADFAALKAAVAGTMARDDIPAHVYALATGDLNRRFMLRAMEAEAALSATGATVALPDDYLAMRALWHDDAFRTPLDAVSEWNAAAKHATGLPQRFAVSGSMLRLSPAPDGTYPLRMRYVARIATPVADADTNVFMTDYPAAYLYAALRHAAVWAQDLQMAAAYLSSFEGEAAALERRDQLARYPGPLRRQALATP